MVLPPPEKIAFTDSQRDKNTQFKRLPVKRLSLEQAMWELKSWFRRKSLSEWWGLYDLLRGLNSPPLKGTRKEKDKLCCGHFHHHHHHHMKVSTGLFQWPWVPRRGLCAAAAIVSTIVPDLCCQLPRQWLAGTKVPILFLHLTKLLLVEAVI